MSLYLIANGPMQVGSAFAGAQTGTAIRTLLQVKMNANANNLARIVEWGISFDGQAAAAPIKCELFTTTTAITLSTAHAAADIDNLTDPNGAAVTTDNPFTLSTSTTAFATSQPTEGSPATIRNFDIQQIAPTNQYIKQFPLGREPTFNGSQFVRIRVTAGADRLAYCYLVIEV